MINQTIKQFSCQALFYMNVPKGKGAAYNVVNIRTVPIVKDRIHAFRWRLPGFIAGMPASSGGRESAA